MKLLNRLRDLRNENGTEFNDTEILTDSYYTDLLGVGAATSDDISRLNIADTHHANLYRQQD